MSHSNQHFNGVLQPLLDTLGRTQTLGKLLGKEIATGRNDLVVIFAVDSKNDTHLLLSPSAISDSRLSNINLRGLSISEREWAVESRSTQKYLDVLCSTGEFPSFKRPFFRFAEDLLQEVSTEGISPAEAILKTCERWQKFWDSNPDVNISTQWIHGLYGELSFLVYIINRYGNKMVGLWSGPMGADHDFQKGNIIGIEVKASTQIPVKIYCNIHQLDYTLFKTLLLVCYKVQLENNGISIVELVVQIEKILESDDEMLEAFRGKLIKLGYDNNLVALYQKTRLSGTPVFYKVGPDFPKIIENSFTVPPDHRIGEIRYALQIVGMQELSAEQIDNELKDFGK